MWWWLLAIPSPCIWAGLPSCSPLTSLLAPSCSGRFSARLDCPCAALFVSRTSLSREGEASSSRGRPEPGTTPFIALYWMSSSVCCFSRVMKSIICVSCLLFC